MRRIVRFERWENPFDDIEGTEAVIQDFMDRNFNIWILHSNFEMNNDTLDLLWDIPGVEVLEPLTRYRLKIAFGRLFKEEEVKTKINRMLLFSDHQQLTLTDTLKEQVDRAADILKDYAFWIIMVLPNGKMNTASAQSYDPTFERTYELFRETQRAVGAYVESYDDRQTELGAPNRYQWGDYDQDSD